MESIYIKFTRGGWDESKWQNVYSPRWEVRGKWKQLDDCIANVFPGDPDSEYPAEKLEAAFASMLYMKVLEGSVRVETTCSFHERMAPLLVLVPRLVPIYREHIEIVLYDRGINIWHHFYEDGRPFWKLIGFHNFALEPDTKYKLVAELRRTPYGVILCTGVDEPSTGIRLPDEWHEPCFAGITACEGHNSFYDFKICDVSADPKISSRIH